MNNKDNNNLFDMYNAGTPEDNNSNDIEQVNLISEKKETKNLIDIKDEKKEESQEENKFLSKNKDTKAVPDYIMNDGSKGTDDIEYLSDEALLRIYVGNNYEKLSKGSFSLPTFFFGMYYLFYRRVYAISVPALVLLAVSYFTKLPTMAISVLMGIITIVISLFFKKLYMNRAKRFVASLQASNLSNTDKKRRARNNGGVDNRVFIVIIAIGALASMTTIKDTYNTYQNQFNKVINPEIEYTIPSWAKNNIGEIREDNSDRKSTYSYHNKFFTYQDDTSLCNYRIYYTDEYTTSNKEANIETNNFMTNTFNKDVTFTNKEYGNYKYRYYYDENEKTHYYVHISDRQLMLLKIEVKKDSSKKCDKLTSEMLNTAKEYKESGK